MGELITQSEYARRRGVAKSAVARAVAEGRIRLIEGKVDPEVADIQWAKNTRARADAGKQSTRGKTVDPPQRPVDPEGQGIDYADHRARRERAEADKAELEARRMAGQLVEKDAVERGAFAAFRELRNATENALRDAADRLVGLTDVREIEHRLLDAYRAAHAQFEARIRSLGQEPDR